MLYMELSVLFIFTSLCDKMELTKISSAQGHTASVAKGKSNGPDSRPIHHSLLCHIRENEAIVLIGSISFKGHCRWKVGEWHEDGHVFLALGTLPRMRRHTRHRAGVQRWLEEVPYRQGRRRQTRKTGCFSPRHSLALVGIRVSEGITIPHHVPQEFLKINCVWACYSWTSTHSGKR